MLTVKVMTGSSAPFTGRLSDADLRSLRVFCAVVRNGGFSPAEADLQISLSAISRDVSNLETRVGLKLCSRGKTGFALTHEGRKFHAAAITLLAAVDDFGVKVNEVHNDFAGELNIGMVDLLWSHPSRKIANMIAAFAGAQKKVHLNLSVLSPHEIERRVHDASLDIGVVISRRKISSLAYTRLFVERNYLYCAQGHPLFERALDSLPLSELRNHAFAGRANSRAASFYRNLSRRATCNGADLIAMLISTGAYIGFLPEHFVNALAELERFRPIMPEKVRANVPVYLVSRRNLEDMRMTQAFVRTLRQGKDSPLPRTGRRS